MVQATHLAALLSGLLLLAALGGGGVQACDICGRECMGSCGDTRTFVTCCYNYLRKRGVNGVADAPLGLAPLPAGYGNSLANAAGEPPRSLYQLRRATRGPAAPALYD